MESSASKRLERLQDAVSGRPAQAVLDDITRLVLQSSSLCITAHVNPDGDALGSAVALGLAARALGKEAEVIFDTPPPRKLLPVIPDGILRIVPEPAASAKKLSADLWVLLDTSEPGRAGSLRSSIFADGQRRVCVDHHLCRGPSSFLHHLVLPEAPSTGSLVLALLDRLGAPLTLEIAQALWMAMSTDTGWFRFENAGPWVLEDAARLAETGIDIPWLYRCIYEESSLGRMRLLGRVLSGLRAEIGGAFVHGAVSARELEAEGLSISELDGVVDHIKAVEGALIVALIVEVAPGSLKVSLRAQGQLEVESLARKFGGGGHAKAAGCRFTGTVDELLSALRPEVRARVEAAQTSCQPIPGGSAPRVL